MDVREKLVELLDEAEEWADHKCDELDCETCYAGKMKGNCVQKLMVDRLIDHGVTVQEFGHWVYDFNLAGSNFYRCSVCDRQETLLEKEDIYEYCPFCHCGAKMMPQPPKGE